MNYLTLEKLREFKNTDWFTVNNEELMQLLDKEYINYSHIVKEKWELVRFIKFIINNPPVKMSLVDKIVESAYS